jgi:hypothetical protein
MPWSVRPALQKRVVQACKLVVFSFSTKFGFYTLHAPHFGAPHFGFAENCGARNILARHILGSQKSEKENTTNLHACTTLVRNGRFLGPLAGFP